MAVIPPPQTDARGRGLRHSSTETTQVYTLLADKVANAEIRADQKKPSRTNRLGFFYAPTRERFRPHGPRPVRLASGDPLTDSPTRR